MSIRNLRENVSRAVFFCCAAVVIVLMAVVFYFIGSRAYQTFTVHHVDPVAFFTGAVWQPRVGQVGALPMLVGSGLATLLAVMISTPISVGVAIFVSEMAPPWARTLMQPVLELFLGIPSIIYGFLGLLILVPILASIYNSIAGGYLYNGYGIVAASLVLAIMILPTITTVSADALRGLSGGLREASAALGATRWQTITKTLVPAAMPGILTGVILGIGRAIGETLAVSYVIGGNPSRFPFTFDDVFPYLHFLPTSTVTVQMLFDFGEVELGSLDYDSLWTLSFMLLIFTLLLVLASRWVASRSAFAARPRREGPGWLALSGLARGGTSARFD